MSEARRVLERRAIACWPFEHATRSRLLHAWAGLEAAAAQTRRGLHEQHTGTPDNSNGCCAPLIELYQDRAEVVRALTVVEEQISRRILGRSPALGAMPARLRRMAERQFADLVNTSNRYERAETASSLATLLEVELGAATDPIRSIYVG